MSMADASTRIRKKQHARNMDCEHICLARTWQACPLDRLRHGAMCRHKMSGYTCPSQRRLYVFNSCVVHSRLHLPHAFKLSPDVWLKLGSIRHSYPPMYQKELTIKSCQKYYNCSQKMWSKLNFVLRKSGQNKLLIMETFIFMHKTL